MATRPRTTPKARVPRSASRSRELSSRSTAKEAGTSKVTITGTASMAASSFASFTDSLQRRPCIAFQVMVVDKMLTVETLAADPTEIPKRAACRPSRRPLSRPIVAGDGEVMIALAASVGNATLDMDSITIAMGATSGSAMLTAADRRRLRRRDGDRGRFGLRHRRHHAGRRHGDGRRGPGCPAHGGGGCRPSERVRRPGR